MDVPYVMHETWMTCPSHVYIDRNLPEDQELDGNVGILPKLILVWR